MSVSRGIVRVRNAVLGVNEPLIGDRSQPVELALLGARTAAVMRRLSDGLTLDDYDHAVLSRAESMLRDAANAIEFVSSRGKLGSHPQSYSFSAVALTLQAATRDAPDDSVVQYLRSVADAVASLVRAPDSDIADSITPMFSALASIATSYAGSHGDSVRFLRAYGPPG